MTEPLSINALEDLALEFRRVAAQTPGRARRYGMRRPGPLAILAALTIAGSATAGVLAIDRGDPIPPAPRGDFSAEQQPLDSTARLSGVSTSDPAEGPPWGLVTYRSEAGRHCNIVGRVVDGKLGEIKAGTFRELPVRGPGGNCVRFNGPDEALSMAVRRYAGVGDLPRTAVHGVTSALVQRLEITGEGGSKTLIPGDERAYLAVFKDFPRVTMTVHLTDGTSQFIDFGPYVR